MVAFSEVVNRALNGPILVEKEFDQNIFMVRVAEKVSKYDIKYDSDVLISEDDELADRVFQAALELYTEVGTYCIDSNRIIQFSEDEVVEALRAYRKQGLFGTGIDAKKFPKRTPECDIPPWCSVGAGGGAVSSEEILSSLMAGYAMIPLADSLTTPSLLTVDGEAIRANTPVEVEGSIRTIQLAKEAIKRAGRPGMPIVNGVSSASTDVATIAADAFGLAPTDAWEISAIAEMKVDFSVLNKLAYLRRKGGQQWAATAPILGGYCGGPEGLAVTLAAYHLQALMVNRPEVHHPFCNHLQYTANTGRMMLWPISVAVQAMTRNSPVPVAVLCYTAAGPMTKMVFYEVAAWVLACVASGASIEVGGIALNTVMDHTTPYEPRFACEVAHAATGMSRREANAIGRTLNDRYEKDLTQPPTGKNYRECFDVQTSTPSEEYREFYENVKAEVRELGIPLE